MRRFSNRPIPQSRGRPRAASPNKDPKPKDPGLTTAPACPFKCAIWPVLLVVFFLVSYIPAVSGLPSKKPCRTETSHPNIGWGFRPSSRVGSNPTSPARMQASEPRDLGSQSVLPASIPGLLLLRIPRATSPFKVYACHQSASLTLNVSCFPVVNQQTRWGHFSTQHLRRALH